jgi:hypothetical protein
MIVKPTETICATSLVSMESLVLILLTIEIMKERFGTIATILAVITLWALKKGSM